MEWRKTRIQGQEPLALRTARKLVADQRLLIKMGATNLKMELDKGLWGDADHLSTKQLWDYLASYLYLARLRDRSVLEGAINFGLSQLVCDQFAYAERLDEATGRYEGLRAGGGGGVVLDSLSVLVKPEAAKRQLSLPTGGERSGVVEGDTRSDGGEVQPPRPTPPALKRRFFGTVEFTGDRLMRDVGKIWDEVLRHLADTPGARMNITLEIDATGPAGFDDATRRTVGENAKTLRFRNSEFTEE